MKRYIIILLIVIILIILAIFIFFKGNNSINTTNTENIKDESFTSNENNSYSDFDEEESKNRIANILANRNEIIASGSTEVENQISSYSTIIKDKEAGRLTNISLTCSILNNTIVRRGQTFSFNEIVGEPTIERGYQEASVIINQKTERGIGGGNCQVSSTIYNAVLAVPGLTVIERHEHGKDVAYVPEGKDAAVSYGSLDLKFRNDLDYDIFIEATTDQNSIVINLFRL